MKNKPPFSLIILLLAAALAWPAPFVHAKAGNTPMQAYVEALGPGWNMGNTFEASGDETSWGNPPVTRAFIDQLAAEGYKTIRLPITWRHRMGDAPDYTIDPAFMARIQEVVDWSLEAKMHVMINLHHDSNWIMNMAAEHDEVMARFNAAWTQIAGYFKDYPDTLMFESVNEPRYSDDWSKDEPEYFTMLDELNVSFHSIVRSSGGNNGKRPLVLSTLTAAPTEARLLELSKTITKLQDKRLIATFHYYGYYAFSVNTAGAITFDDTARQDLIQAFDRAYDIFTSKGIPVIVGEYGLLGFDKSLETVQHGEILKFFEYIGYYAREKKMPLLLWDNGQHFDRRTFKWVDEELHQVMVQGWKGRSSNAQSDSLYIRKDSPIQDTALELNMNGNTFSELRAGDKVLTEGTDYRLEGERLILTSSLMERLLTEEYGVNAVLTAKFSGGADWPIKLIRYDTPVLRSSQGPQGIYSLPVLFNGDSLATLEAVYTGGGNAGPDEWTPYKEYIRHFYPDYKTGEIKFTDAFWSGVKDGEMQLRMHFRSGEIVPYTITKEGFSIIGVSAEDALAEEAVQETGQPSEAPQLSAEPEEPAVSALSPAGEEAGSEPGSGSRLTVTIVLITGLVVLAAAGIYWGKRGKRKRGR
ncbi:MULTISPECIES: cellulase family glycosylhydrolase [unclassified Paenibacillus]|uniref:cellulase family glycosylhydrolase n=1 Tax=unclassified Paenibacillus TaxID=185978 RepID=UPI0024062AA7|nr:MULTISPECIES: cellulase family glycosylhydrolase [unclassified Paenibacillus]MDF9844491.1 endoglucanase [Paenibacillus sp. PastF-2]MDF9851095.1 endoglucanase [Paenibacillus sp. PastM-2]MDF9857667.1 endoglucanase [Paenibacillus sp. PastF-1]MDH6482933.1 endoglucanase [Paenibacillus sp. PastH-2]MDH6510358.1 endoglucanase [Paenibacillus sp. PastM-3]